MIPVRQITYNPDSKSEVKITRKILDDDNTKGVEIAVPLKNLISFSKTFETPLINCKINPIFTCSLTWVTIYSTGARIFAITYSKVFVPVVTLSTNDNANLL